MKRVAVVDFLSPVGHRDINKVTVDALSQIHHVRYIASASYKTIVPYNVSFSPIKESLFTIGNNAILNRIRLSIAFVKICCLLKKKKADVIWVMSYDTIVLYCFSKLFDYCVGKNARVLLMNHMNIDELTRSGLKKSMFNKLGNKYESIVYSGFIKKFVQDIGNIKCHVLPHNLNNYKIDEIGSIRSDIKDFFESKGETYVVMISGNGVDPNNLDELIDLDKRGILTEYHLKIYIKEKSHHYHSDSLCINSCYLSDCEYTFMLSNTSYVMLPYNVDYKYRASGVYFDALTFNKPIIYTETSFFIEEVSHFGELGVSIKHSLEQVLCTIVKSDYKLFENNIRTANSFYQDDNYKERISQIIDNN